MWNGLSVVAHPCNPDALEWREEASFGFTIHKTLSQEQQNSNKKNRLQITAQ